MRKSTRLLAIFLAVLMTVSVLPIGAFAVNNVITAVDTSELVMETVFPYNAGSGSAFWSANVSNVTNPTFYATIPATVDGSDVQLPVTWECTTDYDCTAVGKTYTFEAVAEGYVWECEAPVITVKIVDAGFNAANTRIYGFSSTGDIIPVVIKNGNNVSVVYDATGCNRLLTAYDIGSNNNDFNIFAGVSNKAGTGKTPATSATGDTSITLEGSTLLTRVLGGSYGMNHTGDTYIYANNATLVAKKNKVAGLYGGNYNNVLYGNTNIYVTGTSTIPNIIGGNNGGEVVGNANIDISGKATITNVYGGGLNGGALSGTATVTIHDLEEGSEITKIERGGASKLVVKLDGTSAHLVSNVSGFGTDSSIKVYINEENYVGLVDETTITGIPETFIVGEASEVLPTTFGTLSGYMWSGDDTTAGTKTFTLTAPTGYFFEGYVKTKNFTIVVNEKLVDVTGVTIDQHDVKMSVGETVTLTATVEPYNANDKTALWSTEDTDIIEIDSQTGKITAKTAGEATVTATAGSVSDTCTVTVSNAILITDVNTEGLVFNTVFPYNNPSASANWSVNESYVENPVFYPKLSVLIEGETEYKQLPVTWVCTDENGIETEYDGTATGTTYYFVAKATGYRFADGAPTIEVKIVDAGFNAATTRVLGFSSTGDIVPVVVKDGDNVTVLYDATGFNRLLTSYDIASNSNDYNLFAGVSNKAGTGKTPATSATGDTSLTLDGSTRLTRVLGGSFIPQEGNSYVYVKDSTLVEKKNKVTGVYGGGYGATATLDGDAYIYVSGTSIIPNIYGGGNGASVTGNVYIDITGSVTITNIYGGSFGGGAVEGTAYLTIHELDVTSSIGNISKGTASAMVIDVDTPETAKMVFAAVSDWTGITAKINGVEMNFVKEVDFGDFRIEMENGAQLNLPKVFVTTIAGNIVEVNEADYEWVTEEFDANKSGEYVFTLKFNDNYHFIDNAQYNNTLVVYVKTASADVKTVSEITSAIPQSVSVPEGTALKDVNILSSIQAYTYGAGQTANDAVLGEIRGITWTSSDYNANEVGEYTFTMVLPDGYKMSNPVTVTVSVMKVERPTIIAINVPVTETYFTNGVVTSPKFYDSLEVEVLHSDTTTETVTVRGITWKCNGTYRASTVGEYEFVIDPSSFGGKYEVREGLLEETTITASVLDATIGNNATYYRTNTETLIPMHFVDNNDGTTAYRDLTGFNMLRSVGSSAAASVVAGGNYRLDVTPGQTARIDMSSGVLSAIVAGSLGKEFTGNAEINMFGTATVTDIVAGTANEAFNGNTHITVADEAEITRIVAGSHYRANAKISGSGAVVGSQEAVAYNGTITITIKDTFTGSIGSIEKTSTDKLILNCPATFPYARYVDITDPTIEVYVDGVRVQYVTQIKAPDTAVHNVALGTENISLPTTLTATVNGAQGTIDGVTWVCENYDADSAGKYTFTPVIPERYDISSVDMTNISVVVRVLTANAGQSSITAFAPLNTVLASLGTAQKDIALPQKVTATVNGQQIEVEVDRWACSNYDGSVYGAEYTFTATVSGEYALGTTAPTVTVKITNAKIAEIYLPVTATTFPKGMVETPVFYNTLKVKLDNGTVTEISGFEWFVKDYNKNTVGKYTATIKSAPANCEFASSLNVPVITITVTNKKHDTGELDGNVYLYGIPTVIDGDNDAVYLYDITGCNRISDTNIVGKSVYAGGPADSGSLKTTMVEVRGGKLASLYGGSRDRTKITDTAYTYVFGGSFANIYAGGTGGTSSATRAYAQNTYLYIENANVSTRVSAAGYNGNVQNDATVIVKNASLNAMYGCSYSKKGIAGVDGTTTIKLLDGAKVQKIYGSGRVSTVNELEVYLSKNAAVTAILNPTGHSYITGTAKIFYEKGFDLSTTYTEDENVKLYEGYFLEDRETFVKEREIKIIRNPGLVRGDFYVDYGTSLEDIGLPTTVEGEIDGQLTAVSGITYTPVSVYDGNTAGRYEFKLNVPDGYNIPYTAMKNAGVVTVVVTEPAQSDYITAVQGENTQYTFANGTAIENIALPSAYSVVLSAGKQKVVPVKDWKVTDENGRAVTYDRYTAGTYVFTPEFDSAYKVLSSVEMPTHTVKLLAHRPGRDGNIRYLHGVPADINGLTGITPIVDKNGNYLEQAGQYITVYAGSDRTNLEFTDITVNGGQVRTLYVGSSNRDISGDATVTVNGGSVTYLYGGTSKATMQNVYITVNGGTIASLYGNFSGTIYGRINYEVNDGMITNFYMGANYGNGSTNGTPQEETEILAMSSLRYPDEPIVVEKGELISSVYVQNGGTVQSLYAEGGVAGSKSNGSVKVYLNGGTTGMVSGGGYVADAITMGNVYIVVSNGADCDTVYANAPGTIYGKAYVVVPDDFNRYDILGWDEDGDDIIDDPNADGDDEDAALTDGEVSAEVIVSGGYYEEDIPVRILYINGTQTVYARGVPIKVIGELDVEDEGDLEDITGVPTYIWYFDENYDAQTETPETFSYETYVDAEGNPLVLTGVWRKIPEQLTEGATVVFGGGMQSTTDKYPSTYVEFISGYVKNIYGGGKNNTVGVANLVLNAEGAYNTGAVIFGGGNNSASTVTNKVHVTVLRGSYDTIAAGGYNVTCNGTQVDILGGSVDRVYMGTQSANGTTVGKLTLNLENCTVGSIYGGSGGTSGITVGPVYINVNENVNITGTMYPKGSGVNADGVTSGSVKTYAYVSLNEIDKAASQLKKLKYSKSQAPYIYVNGVAMGEMPASSTATFETAEKKVQITTHDASDYRANRPLIFLNGIPTVIAGDGAGRSYLYQAKTKDGTLNAYQKNEDGTFKKDANGERISNIVRDPVTGQAIKGPKLIDIDTIDYVVYGGADGKSVEDVYVEFQTGGGMWVFYAGCRGGNAGYDAQGNEVGLVEVRQFGGGAFDEMHAGSTLGYDLEGNLSVNSMITRTVFLGISGGSKLNTYGGLAGTIGSEEKFIDGYYNKAGEVISYTDPDDNQVYEITGTWEDYNLDVTKEDYAEYYESTNARFNGENNTDFLGGDYYVDPYDDHYSMYVLLGDYSTGYNYLGTYSTEYNAVLNRVYGNAYIRQSVYGLKYDAELDMFVEDYNDYLGNSVMFGNVYGGSTTGVRYNDVRVDNEGYRSNNVYPFGRLELGAISHGHTYVNLYETDTNSYMKDESYKKFTVKSDPNLTVNHNFYPRWSWTSAWALDVDENLAQVAIDKGYITEVTDPKDVRISMLSADDAAKLLNYYYTGSFDESVTTQNAAQTKGYQQVFDASDDAGKFVIRHFEIRKPADEGYNRFVNMEASRFGDSQLITFPNGETMLIDVGQTEANTLIDNIRYVLEQHKEQGIGDGKTIDYLLITHYHGDHHTNASPIIRAFDIKNLVLPPFDKNGNPTAYVKLVQDMSEKNVSEGKDPINIIRVQRGDKFTIGEGDETVQIDVVNPGDHSYRTYSLEEAIRRIENGGYSSFANPCSIGLKFTFKGQTYFTAGDIREDAEVSMLRTYGKDFLNCDVMKLSHHGHATSNIWAFLNAVTPDVALMNTELLYYKGASVPKYIYGNNTGGYAEDLFMTGVSGNIKVVMDGEKITSVTQFQPYAYQHDTDEYRNLETSYNAMLDRVADAIDSLTVVADGATAPYGTAYIWKSHSNYIDGQFGELSKRFYSGTMSTAMLEDYTEMLLELEQFIDDATMYGGTDTTPDVEVPGTPGTDEGGSETTTPGTSGGIIGDVGGGDAGSGIGGGAAPGGAVVAPEGPSVDDDRRFIDVATTDWFNNAVNYVADNNYFQGVSENQFDPNGKMTRAMLVTVIGRMAKADTSEAVNNFTDVEDGSWYAGYVAWAAENGIVTGVGDSKFAPNDNVTREQIAAILMRYAKYKGIDVSVDSTEKYDSMKDTDKVSEYAVEALKWATANAVINGAEGNINPRGNATRAEVAQMIMNFCNTFSI